MSVIIGVAGTKQSGKSSLCKYLLCCFHALIYNAKNKEKKIDLSKIIHIDDGSIGYEEGYKFPLHDIWENVYNVKIYSFADKLKEFCIDVMGLKEEHCYGTDEQKNSYTDLVWDNLPYRIKAYYSNETIETTDQTTEHISKYEIPVERSGFMTGREVMQVFATDVMRNMWDDTIWAKSTIRAIKKDVCSLSLISDLRFKSEVDLLLEQPNSYLIYLKRKLFYDKHKSEVDLIDYDFTKWGANITEIENTNKKISEKNAEALEFLKKIFKSQFDH